MIYEGQICRGPMERSSFMLPVAVGCSYNRCRFCNLFKHLKYRQLPMEQVEEEILRVQALGGDPETVFLGDGNAFGLETGHLLEIAGKIRRSFPSCRSINMDATVTNIRLKSDEELRALAAAGVGHLYLGIESGLDDVLGTMEKDHTLEQAYEQIQRLRAAGLIYDAHIMTGIAGRGRGLEKCMVALSIFMGGKYRRVSKCHLILPPVLSDSILFSVFFRFLPFFCVFSVPHYTTNFLICKRPQNYAIIKRTNYQTRKGV